MPAQTRIQALRYPDVEAFVLDFQTMFDNAQVYNMEGSEVYVDAAKMREEFVRCMDAVGFRGVGALFSGVQHLALIVVVVVVVLMSYDGAAVPSQVPGPFAAPAPDDTEDPSPFEFEFPSGY